MILCTGEALIDLIPGPDGTIRPVRGVLPAVLAARSRGVRRVIVPQDRVDDVVTALAARVNEKVVLGDPRTYGVTGTIRF